MLIAVAWGAGDVGLGTYTDQRIRDLRLLALAGKMRYRVDPEDPYPQVLRGHMRVRLADGRTIEQSEPHLRGGINQPLIREEATQTFRGKCAFGGCSATSAAWLFDFGGQVLRVRSIRVRSVAGAYRCDGARLWDSPHTTESELCNVGAPGLSSMIRADASS